jgi:RecJ-like exonuclease
MEELMDDPYSQVPQGTEWCPECNGYGSSPMEETERCSRCGGSGLVLVDPADEQSNGEDPARRSRQD